MHCLPAGMIPEVNGVDLECLDHVWSGVCKFEHDMPPDDALVMLDTCMDLIPSISCSQNTLNVLIKIYLSLVYFAMMITSVLAFYLQVPSTVTPPSRVTQ